MRPALQADSYRTRAQVKAAIKATYEEPEHESANLRDSKRAGTAAQLVKPAKGGGNRSATQVACNALLGTLCAVTWRYLYSGESGQRSGWQEGGRWCVTARTSEGGQDGSRALVLTAVAFWAACCGDTVRSPELYTDTQVGRQELMPS